MAFEYIKGDTFFHRLDPRVKLIFWGVMIALVLLVDTDPISLGIILSIVIIIPKISKIPMNKISSFLRSISPVASAYLLFNLLFPPAMREFEEPYILLYLPFGLPPLSIESIIWSIGALFRFLIILLVIRVTLMLTPLRDLILAFIKLKMPPEFGVALTTGFAYVPVMIDENRKIKEALLSRGWKYEYKNPIKRFDALIRRMLIPSIYNSIRRTGDIAIAIESRGFSHDISKRTYLRTLKMSKIDYLTIIVLLMVVIVAYILGPWGIGISHYKNTVKIIKSLLINK